MLEAAAVAAAAVGAAAAAAAAAAGVPDLVGAVAAGGVDGAAPALSGGRGLDCGVCFERITFYGERRDAAAAGATAVRVRSLNRSPRVPRAGELESCDHPLCFECATRWSETSNVCPTCRQRFSIIRKITVRAPAAPTRATPWRMPVALSACARARAWAAQATEMVLERQARTIVETREVADVDPHAHAMGAPPIELLLRAVRGRVASSLSPAVLIHAHPQPPRARCAAAARDNARVRNDGRGAGTRPCCAPRGWR